MARHPPIAASATLREAADRLHRSDVDGLVVLLDDGLVAGVFAERDLVFAAHAAQEGQSDRVGDYVDARFVRAGEDDSVEEVLRKMGDASARRAIVFDEDENPTGLIAPERPRLAPPRGHADFVLEVEGVRYGASAPELGDSTRDEPNDQEALGRITFGVTALGAARLDGLVGRDGRLLSNPVLDRTGAAREVARFTIVKIDVESALIVGELAPRRPRAEPRP